MADITQAPRGPVPNLPLDMLFAAKAACEPSQQTGGSDRSCRSRAPVSAHLGSEATHRQQALACPEQVPTYGDGTTLPALPSLPPRYTEASDPETPHSNIDCETPRTNLDISSLTLHSPQSARQYSTPARTPRLSPHSPRSPSMMSPLRMLGTKSPCSERIVGSQRIVGGQVIPSNACILSPTGAAMKTSPKAIRPPVQRALPFSERKLARPSNSPAAAGTAPASGTSPHIDRFKMPSPTKARELSFSDLLSGAGRLPHRDSPSRLLPMATAYGVPLLVPPHSHAYSHRHAVNHTAPQCVNDASTPRKRARKMAAPQRAAFGSGDSGSLEALRVENSADPGSSAGETNGCSGMEEDAAGHASSILQRSPLGCK